MNQDIDFNAYNFKNRLASLQKRNILEKDTRKLKVKQKELEVKKLLKLWDLSLILHLNLDNKKQHILRIS